MIATIAPAELREPSMIHDTHYRHRVKLNGKELAQAIAEPLRATPATGRWQERTA